MYGIIRAKDELSNEFKYEFNVYTHDNMDELPYNKRGIFILGKKNKNNLPTYINIQYTEGFVEVYKQDLFDRLYFLECDCVFFYECDKSLTELDDMVRWINNVYCIY